MDELMYHANNLADLLAETDAFIEETEKVLKEAKDHRNRIAQIELPEVMNQLQLERFTHHDREFKTRLVVRGSWPKDPDLAAKAQAWLKQHKAEGIIKHSLVADFGVGKMADAKKAQQAINKYVGSTLITKVHPSTLAAFARQRITNGEDVALETLGLDAFTHVVINKPKTVR